MPRIAFQLRIRPGKEAAYDKAHRSVWPALVAKLKEVGISNYSIFRRGQQLVLVMDVADFDAAWNALDRDTVNLKWQRKMAPLFAPVPGKKRGERFAMMQEVFFLE